MTDFNAVIEKTCEGWSEEEKLIIESELTNATNSTLCLDPSPTVAILSNNLQHQRNIFSTSPLRKSTERFSLVNRKRKLEAVSPSPGLELHDFIMKKRLKSAKETPNSLSKSKSPRMVLPAPSLESCPLKILDHIDIKEFKQYEWPTAIEDSSPDLIEEYILDTDRQCERDQTKTYHLHIKLSIFQRPFNSEYLGELYLDVDYIKGETKGSSSRFTLGSRSYVDKFIGQFTDMLTKKGRKSMKIVKRVLAKPKHIDKAVEAAQKAQVICFNVYSTKSVIIEHKTVILGMLILIVFAIINTKVIKKDICLLNLL